MQTARLRIMTYNVHRCVGRDRVLSPWRIARAIAAQEPDVVALQELDVNRPRTKLVNQAAVIAGLLQMECFFFPALALKDEHFGNAIMSRHPMTLMHAGLLPALPNHPSRERRAAVWVDLEWNGRLIHLINTHLGLRGYERVLQVEALLSEEWLASPRCEGPQVLCGDLNAIPGTRAYRRLRHCLRDPYPLTAWPPGTFPSGYPLLRLDHVLFSTGWHVHHIQVARTRLTRVASDHLPVIADASLLS